MPKESSIKVGDRFHRLLVIEKLPKDEYDTRDIRRTLFLCKCDCGNTKIIDAGNLKKATKSCGCLQKENAVIQGRKQRTEEGFVRNYYGEYRRYARFKNRCFEISLEDFHNIIRGDCFYCGSPPELRQTKRVVGIPLPVNGVDRVDSEGGYTKCNIVPCCERCNKMKLNLNLEDFYMQNFKIVRNLLNGTQLEHVDVAKKCAEAIKEYFPTLLGTLQ